ncbi:hypothetical protein B0T22DRAFT_213975 [Podospora appendiculata]|uniref:RNase T2-like C-terminal domain-containing protein n=1 Tax=Podospora appendiculata TaxID=314037 RepID=A0AAE0X4Y9_9PEZI|nr:hypothetical protein B0T22DRAFT_213975 [Podospora appendiculata]
MVAIRNILAFAGLAAAGSFNGTGQLRAQWNSGNYTDLGCITAEGLYTSNEDLCGSFDAKATTGSSMYTYTLTSPAGPCQIYGASLTCGKGNKAYQFGIWPWPNSIPNVESLRWGQYGLMASSGKNPPEPNDAPEDIHFVTFSETGKYVWLTWKEL